MFQDLMPISDDYVLYADFASVMKRSDWKALISQMRATIHKTLEQIKAHRHLTDAGIKKRAEDDLNMLIAERTRAYNQLKKKLGKIADERFMRENDDDASTDSDGEEARRAKIRMKKKAA